MTTQDANVPGQGGAAPDRKQFKHLIKPLIVFTVIALGLVVVYCSPLKDYLQQVREIKVRLNELGFIGPLIYMFGVFVLISLGFPRLLFCPIGGLTFGFVHGLIYTQIPTLLGYYILFLFVRWGGRDFVLRHWPKLGRFHNVFDRGAVVTVIMMRQVPISGLVINLLLGLSPIRHRHYLLGTAIGLFPEAIPFTLVASGAVKLRGGESLAYIIGAAALLLVLWGGSLLLMRRSKALANIRGELAEVEELAEKDASS